MRTKNVSAALVSLAVCLILFQVALALPQRGGGRSAGHRGGGGAGGPSRGGGGAGPHMSRPAAKPASRPAPATRPAAGNRPGPGAGANARPGAGGPPNRKPGPAKPPASNFQRPGGANRPGGNNRPNAPGAGNRPGGDNRPNAPGAGNRPGGDNRPNVPGAGNRPGGDNRPNVPGAGNRPGGDNRPGIPGNQRPNRGPSSSQLDDFLGNNKGPGNRDRNNVGNRDRVDGSNRVTQGNRNDNSRDINVGDVNIGNSVNYNDNRQQWVDNRHANGNQVRNNVGNRYNDVYRSGNFHAAAGYNYYNGWNVANNAFVGWRAPTYAAVGAFFGSSLANAQPVYYGYGNGGNVYYEDNTVYVNGTASGTPEEYAQQAFNYVEAAPEPKSVPDEEWMPLGVFALSQENMSDANAVLELAVNKSGVLAGTYYNDSTQVSRPLKGTVDTKSQRAVVGFADGKNADVALETGLYNLTEDEAPSLLHRGTSDSTPVLLVRIPPPEDASAQ